MEIYRPPLFSWIIDAIWVFTGEDWHTIVYVQMAFTIAGIILLYLLLRRRKSAWFALGVSALTLTNAQLFFYTSHIRTEGISLFFLILSLYFLEGTKKAHWILSGISVGLTFAARYPILLQAAVIFLVESILKRDIQSIAKGTIAIVAVILIVVCIVYAKTGTFQMALEKDSNFGSSFSSFYIVNALPIWGPAILLLPVAFLFKSTYKDKFNYIFIAWFFISLLSWSTNASNHQYRFMIQFMPAVYFLVILAIENLIRLDRNDFIFAGSNSSHNSHSNSSHNSHSNYSPRQ
jgi:4-amino-4-deoxy-L-arabinose transferase-like glycosyltransferase